MEKKKLAGALALLVGAAMVAFFALGNLEENIVYYWTPSDLLQKKDTVQGSTIRLGGMVQTDSLDWDADSLNLEFIMSERPDPGGASVKVVSKGAPPQMFREGIGCIVEGRFDGQVFHSERLMVKHSNEYRPPESHEDPRKLYETLITEPQPGALVPDRPGEPAAPATPAVATEERL